MIGSSVWLTHSVEPHTTVTMESPKLRIRGAQSDELGSFAQQGDQRETGL